LDASFRAGIRLKNNAEAFLNVRYLGGGAVGTDKTPKWPSTDGSPDRNFLFRLARGIGDHSQVQECACRRRLLRHESKLQVVDDPIDHLIVREEGDDLHPASALGAKHRIDLIDLADRDRPAFGRDGRRIGLGQAKGVRALPRFPDLPPGCVGIKASRRVI